MKDLTEMFRKTGIVPVIALDDARDALPLAEALCEGGLPCAEVTFRTEAAADSIKIMKERFPQMLVGAGTVLKKSQIDQAMACGAEFIVSPGFDRELSDYCREKDILLIPGGQSPTEVKMILKEGWKTVKFFPAEPSGGLSMIKALAAPFTEASFMPTGGINPQNVRDYLKYDRIVACGGTWMVKKEMICQGEFDRIRALAEEAAGIVKEIRGN